MDTEPARLAAEGEPTSPIATGLEAHSELETSSQQDVPTVLAQQAQILGAESQDMEETRASAQVGLNNSRTGTIEGVLGQQTAMVTAEEQLRIEISTRGQEIVEMARQEPDFTSFVAQSPKGSKTIDGEEFRKSP